MELAGNDGCGGIYYDYCVDLYSSSQLLIKVVFVVVVLVVAVGMTFILGGCGGMGNLLVIVEECCDN